MVDDCKSMSDTGNEDGHRDTGEGGRANKPGCRLGWQPFEKQAALPWKLAAMQLQRQCNFPSPRPQPRVWRLASRRQAGGPASLLLRLSTRFVPNERR